MLTRRRLIALSVAQAVAPNLLIGKGRAQTPKAEFPNKPVRLIVPVAAGGPTDIVARILAEKLATMWRQQVFIENKAGAGNNIGIEHVAHAASRDPCRAKTNQSISSVTGADASMLSPCACNASMPARNSLLAKRAEKQVAAQRQLVADELRASRERLFVGPPDA